MLKKLALFGLTCFSLNAFALPATSDALIKGLISSGGLENIFKQLGSSSSSHDDVFDTVSLKRIQANDGIRDLCKQNGGLSRSAGFIEVTISKDGRSESFVFSTPLDPKDLKFCE
ncbi:MAG: hypothetical protein AB8G05_15620 [Oligoflexales bacterium]